MKRTVRISLRMIGLPLIIPFQMLVAVSTLIYMLKDYIFENPEKFYSSTDWHRDEVQNFKQFWWSFFK